MAAVASIQIEIDEKGVLTALNKLTGEFQKVETGLRKTGSTGNVVMTELVRQQRQANDAASLLGRTLGVQLPRQLEGFLAKSRTIGPILASAFNVSIVGGFAMALTQLPRLIEDMVEGITHWKAETERQTRLQEGLTTAIKGTEEVTRNWAEGR